MPKASWRKIKTEYVTGKDGYRALADRHGISFSSLSKVASKEGWAEARKKYRDKLEAKTEEAMCARACAREVKRLEGLQRAAEKTASILEEVLADPEQFRRHLCAESVSKVGSTVNEKTFLKYDMRAIKDYTAALKTMTEAMRDLYGIPSVVEKSAMDIAAARLEVEKKKAEKEGTNADGEIVIRFEGAPAEKEGWEG